MGVFRRGSRLWLRFKGPDGTWRNARTEYSVGEEREAEKAFRSVTDRIAAGQELLGDRNEPVTVREYAETKWFESRRAVVADWKTDEGRLKIHVLPRLGKMRLEDVRPRHLADLFQKLRASKALAPKSIHNVYGVTSALFRDAALYGLIDSTPCILTERELGKNVDSDPEWRATAIYTRAELEQLLFDERVPLDRRVMYALQGLAGLRHGEAAGLRWRHFDPSTPVLGRLVVATSYDTGRTKTGQARHMPVHPTLAAILAEWRLGGWPAMQGRPPEPDDLVAPTPAPKNRGPRVAKGSMRSDGYSYKRLVGDLATLGLRHRRGHDLRRTFITLARTDGARRDILELCTHTPERRTIDLYTSFPWESLCAEVAKLNVHREARGQVLTLARAVGAEPMPLEPVTSSLHRPLNAADSKEKQQWRRRESNSGF